MEQRVPEIANRAAAKIVGATLAPAIVSVVQSLSNINSVWTTLMQTGVALVSAWGAFGQERINELVRYVEIHKGEFLDEIVSSEKFKSLFLSIIDRHTRESFEEKRKLFRSYLLNVGKGVGSDFDYHTKVLFALDQITLNELRILKWFEKNKSPELINLEKFQAGFQDETLKTLANQELSLHALDTYGLLFEDNGRYDGPFYSITQFGELFLQFVETA